MLHSYHIHCFFFFFNDTATTEIYTLSLHDALPIWLRLWFNPMEDWFYTCGVGRCGATFSGHPFVGLKGELFPFPIFIWFHEVEFSVRIYLQSIYIAIIVQVVNEEFKVLWFCYKASFFL